jgi:hypothetical protein
MVAADLDSQLAAILAASGGTPEEFVTELKASTGWTVGGTWQLDKIMTILVAWAVGYGRDRSGFTDTVERLDGEDQTTPIFDETLSHETPYRNTNVRI